MTLKLKLTLKWNDSRLKYSDLKSNANMNTLTAAEMDQIWMPTLLFINTKNGQTVNFKNQSNSFVTIEINKGKIAYLF